MSLKIKVCGMRDKGNINDLLELQPDFIGFILYPGSQRYVGNNFLSEANFTKEVKKVGVTVNALMKEVVSWKIRLDLDYIQLHGSESPEYCRELNTMGLQLIKAFGIFDDFDFDILQDYIPYCDYFLFDTKTVIHGGSGNKYDWKLINNYKFNVPFFLSGGIRPEDVSMIREIKNDKLFAVDINSGFEISPAFKDIQRIQNFIQSIRTK